MADKSVNNSLIDLHAAINDSKSLFKNPQNVSLHDMGYDDHMIVSVVNSKFEELYQSSPAPKVGKQPSLYYTTRKCFVLALIQIITFRDEVIVLPLYRNLEFPVYNIVVNLNCY